MSIFLQKINNNKHAIKNGEKQLAVFNSNILDMIKQDVSVARYMAQSIMAELNISQEELQSVEHALIEGAKVC